MVLVALKREGKGLGDFAHLSTALLRFEGLAHHLGSGPIG
jgi:hypothetical protein